MEGVKQVLLVKVCDQSHFLYMAVEKFLHGGHEHGSC